MNEDVLGLANFKGVMLCARPDEKIEKQKDKPFCSMIKNNIPVGFNKNKFKEINHIKSKLKRNKLCSY